MWHRMVYCMCSVTGSHWRSEETAVERTSDRIAELQTCCSDYYIAKESEGRSATGTDSHRVICDGHCLELGGMPQLL